MLTDNEKAAIIKAHIKNINSNKYNAELSLIEDEALEESNQDSVNFLQKRISDYNAQINALQSELEKLNVTEENNTVPPLDTPSFT
jgi:uncharacterized protein YlxW (UPF0749 family)